jgi:hypothetical protein
MSRQIARPLASVLLPFVFAIAVAPPASAQGPQAATIDSNLTVRIRPFRPIPFVIARGSVILLTGGNGVLDVIQSGAQAGDIRESQGNFLIRSARLFLLARFNVAMLDAEPAFPDPGGLNNQRLTQTHADHLGAVIGAVRTQWPGKPVWLVGTSNGTLSAVNAAARLKGSNLPNWIVLTSAITASGTAPEETGTVLAASPGLANIGVPTLVAWHAADQCSLSHNSSAEAVFNGLTGLPAAKKGKFVATGGSQGVAMPLCSAFGRHGFNGTEQSVRDAIATFIATH